MLGRWECGPRLIVWTSAELPLSFLCLLCAGRPPLEVRVCLLRPRPALPLLSLCAPPSPPLPPHCLTYPLPPTLLPSCPPPGDARAAAEPRGTGAAADPLACEGGGRREDVAVGVDRLSPLPECCLCSPCPALASLSPTLLLPSPPHHSLLVRSSPPSFSPHQVFPSYSSFLIPPIRSSPTPCTWSHWWHRCTTTCRCGGGGEGQGGQTTYSKRNLKSVGLRGGW